MNITEANYTNMDYAKVYCPKCANDHWFLLLYTKFTMQWRCSQCDYIFLAPTLDKIKEEKDG
jgi:transposase-like protein